MPAEVVPSTQIVLVHLGLTALLAGVMVWAIHAAALRIGTDRKTAARRAAGFGLGLGIWLAGTWALAHGGWLLVSDSVPPRLMFVMGPGLLGSALLVRTSLSNLLLNGVPLWALVGFQSFRIGVELILWHLCREGVLPVQMTFEGANWDVASGLGALGIAWLLRRGVCPRWALVAWNVGGLMLLGNIVVIAVRALPGPLHDSRIVPANTIVLHTVFVWIPALYVVVAWAGHLLVFRALMRKPRAAG